MIFHQLANHLWQSTLFAAFAAILALAFSKNRAQIRHALWLAASLKFLLPFSLLRRAGTTRPETRGRQRPARVSDHRPHRAAFPELIRRAQ